METVVLQGKSKSDLKALIAVAKKLGIMVRYLTEEEQEDIGLLDAMKQGRTKEYVNTDSFVKKLIC